MTRAVEGFDSSTGGDEQLRPAATRAAVNSLRQAMREGRRLLRRCQFGGSETQGKYSLRFKMIDAVDFLAYI